MFQGAFAWLRASIFVAVRHTQLQRSSGVVDCPGRPVRAKLNIGIAHVERELWCRPSVSKGTDTLNRVPRTDPISGSEILAGFASLAQLPISSVVNNRTTLSLSASPASTGRAARTSLLRCPAIPLTGESTLL